MTEKLLTLTIVIPAYNEEHHIKHCLDAIAEQSVIPDEVIVIDNNSTDATAELAKNYAFVKLLQEPQQGIAYARNRGFESATCDVIGRIDADTILPRDWVKNVMDFYHQPGNDKTAITGGCRFYNLHTGGLTARFYTLLVYRYNRLLLGYYFPWGSNSAFPRQLWKDVKDDIHDRPDIHEDLDLGIHFARKGFKTKYLTHMRVGAAAKRVVTMRGELWSWLTMWPRTFRIHGIKTWPFVWPLVIGVWTGRYWIVATEWIGDIFATKKSL